MDRIIPIDSTEKRSYRRRAYGHSLIAHVPDHTATDHTATDGSAPSYGTGRGSKPNREGDDLKWATNAQRIALILDREKRRIRRVLENQDLSPTKRAYLEGMVQALRTAVEVAETIDDRPPSGPDPGATSIR